MTLAAVVAVIGSRHHVNPEPGYYDENECVRYTSMAMDALLEGRQPTWSQAPSAGHPRTIASIRCDAARQLDSLPPSLVGLELRALTLDPTALRSIARFHQLEYLDLSDTKLDERHLSDFPPLANLTALLVYRSFGIARDAGQFFGTTLPHVAPRLKQLEVSDAVIDERAMRGITTLEGLRRLSLTNCSMSDEVLYLLRALPALGHVNLTSCDVSGFGLRGCTGLRHVVLRGTHASDEVVGALSSLPELVSLDLSSTRVHSLVPLTAAQALRELHLDWVQLESLAFLKNVPRLNELSVIGARFPSSDCERLQETRLSVLNLDQTNVTDEFLQFLPRTITRLGLRRTPIGDEGIRHLLAFDHLTALDISDTRVTDQGLATVSQMGLSHLTVRGIGSTAGLLRLRSLACLRLLRIGDRASDTVQQLREALPWCEIVE